MKNTTKFMKYTCLKCGHKEHKIETISTTGGFWTKIFDIQHKKFTAIICARCTYTELYRISSNKIENIFDFITN